MPESVSATRAQAAEPSKPYKLDDLMIAMDVVDTIRHREDLVRRELNHDVREGELIERLREIYRQQGIEVTDRVLAEGVRALKESRFTYKPRLPSLKRSIFEIWVARYRYAKIWSIVAAIGLAAFGSYYFYVKKPREIARERNRIELNETLPRTIRDLYVEANRLATDGSAKPRAEQLIADGERAIAAKDRVGMSRVATDLRRLNQEVAAEYTLTIVSRPGETTGVWRRPPRGATLRNHYIIVEPIAQDGRKVQLPIRNEETGDTHVVDKFGVRVSQATFEAVAADKRDDGIVQRSRFGVKKRGTLTVEYLMPFEGGMITKW